MMMILKIVLFLLLFLYPNFTFAYTKAGNIYTTDGSYADVNAAIGNANPDDTIELPAGTFTWGTSLTISKKIVLKGQGKTLTTINTSAGSGIHLNNANASGTRITGINIVSTASPVITIGTTGTGAAVVVKDFRIDNCRIQGVTYGVYVNYSSRVVPPQGLIDNCDLIGSTNVVSGVNYDDTMYDFATWSVPTNLGGANFVFFEDCIFESNSFITPNQATDVSRGGGMVVRFSTIRGKYSEVHGYQGNNPLNARSGRKWEYYRNDYSSGGSYASNFVPFHIRGGTGVIFDNTFAGYGSNQIYFNHYRSGSSLGSCLQCDGTSPCDGNEVGQQGYLCRDQPGAGADQWTWTAGNPYPPQAKEPVYIWGNTSNVPILYGSTGTHFVENRDFYRQGGTVGVGVGTLANMPASCTTGQGYWATDQGNWNKKPGGTQGVLYKCVSTNNWQLYYTPYTYPHPSGAVPQAPKNLRIME